MVGDICLGYHELDIPDATDTTFHYMSIPVCKALRVQLKLYYICNSTAFLRSAVTYSSHVFAPFTGKEPQETREPPHMRQHMKSPLAKHAQNVANCS